MCQLSSKKQDGAQVPPGLEVGRELRGKGMGNSCSSGQACVQVPLRQGGLCPCVSLRGELLALFTRLCQGRCVVAVTHAVAWYSLIVVSGAH